jgi:hypothetical protein
MGSFSNTIPAMRRLAPLVLLALALFLPADEARSQPRPVTLQSALGRCLDVAAANSGNGASVQLWECNGTPAQSWWIEGLALRSTLGRCLDVASGNPANGASVQLWDCNGTPAQQWSMLPGGVMRNGLGRCLDVASANPANGASVQLYDCNGTPAQSWTLR